MYEFAKAMRNDPTDAEYRLWYHLSNRQLLNHKFRRQHPIPPYIVDFCCIEKKIIIELDGGQHAEDGHAIYDKKRDEFLKNAGYDVIRFWNQEVMKNIDSVIETILYKLEHKY
ncbi:MAG: endonuclease domain-containing protein [Alphaproteobacteria bacterium]|nr:MAG: endonuclease domain-containing protein [Alphaproteobacteria bacterium]